MKRLNVLFMTPWYPTKELPVAGVFVREHAKAVDLYDKVVVLHTPEHTRIPLLLNWILDAETDESLTEGIPAYHLYYKRNTPRPVSYTNRIWSHVQTLKNLIAQGFRPDIIHAHVYRAGAMGIILGKLFKIPVVITEHYTAFPRRQLSKYSILEARFAFRFAKCVMPVSYSLMQSIRDYGMKANFQIVPCVVNTDIFYPREEDYKDSNTVSILFVGILSPAKGIPFLFEALAKLTIEWTLWSLDIIGDGPQKEDYIKLAHELGISQKIRWHGYKAKSEVAEIMRQADLLVLPSLWENLPSVIAEALTTGLPVVATNVGGVPEMIDTTNGRLVSPSDSEALSRAILDVGTHIKDFDRKKLIQTAQRYTYQNVGLAYHKIYEVCLI